MKQNTTIEDIEHLREAQKAFLLRQWKPKIGDKVYNLHTKEEGFITWLPDLALCQINGILYNNNIKEIAFPLLSIGQLLESILEGYGGEYNIQEAFIKWVNEEIKSYLNICDFLFEEMQVMLALKGY